MEKRTAQTPKARPSLRADGSYSSAWRNVSKIILRPGIRVLMKLNWKGQEHFPAGGGLILAVNHLSYMDILAVSLFTDSAGRYPVFLAKSSLFRIPLLGPIILKLGQLPVERGSMEAGAVLRVAEQGLGNGACMIFYPEGTVTRDPQLWPMVAKTGVARLALTTGAPVVPIAHWGAERILPYGSFVPKLLPRKKVQIVAGPPVDLSEFAGLPLTTQTLRAATDKIMKDVAGLLGELRGLPPPADPYHPAAARRKLRQDLRTLQQTGGETEPSPDSAPGATQP